MHAQHSHNLFQHPRAVSLTRLEPPLFSLALPEILLLLIQHKQMFLDTICLVFAKEHDLNNKLSWAPGFEEGWFVLFWGHGTCYSLDGRPWLFWLFYRGWIFTPRRCSSWASGSPLNSASNPKGFLLPSHRPLGSPGQAQWRHWRHFHIPCGKWWMSKSCKLAPVFGLQRWGRRCHVRSLGGPTHLADLEIFDFSLISSPLCSWYLEKGKKRSTVSSCSIFASYCVLYWSSHVFDGTWSSERGFFPWKISSTPAGLNSLSILVPLLQVEGNYGSFNRFRFTNLSPYRDSKERGMRSDMHGKAPS